MLTHRAIFASAYLLQQRPPDVIRAMAALRLPSGEELRLSGSVNKLSLGRQQFVQYKEAVFVGRNHCTVQLSVSDAGNEEVRVQSEHANPTVVIHKDGKQAEVQQGELHRRGHS